MDKYYKARKFMIKDLKAKGIYDKNVLIAMEKIRRDLFVPQAYKESSYEDRPLPLIKNQTISQPYTVAYMLQELELKEGLKVLEIGTGSGYNAALIAEIVKPGRLYTIEIVKELVKLAKDNLKKAKINNVRIIEGDGSKGYEKEAKYDRIVFTASAPEIPKPLKDQLKDNGIVKFMAKFTNSYTKYFNTKRERVGPLFQGVFKAVHVGYDEQLLHLSRYIHLNPVLGFIAKVEELESYPWSSYPEYLGKVSSNLVNKAEILTFFKGPSEYEKFVLDQADYAMKLKTIEHLRID